MNDSVVGDKRASRRQGGNPLEEVREILTGADLRRQQRRLEALEAQVVALSGELRRISSELTRLQSQPQGLAGTDGGSRDAE